MKHRGYHPRTRAAHVPLPPGARLRNSKKKQRCAARAMTANPAWSAGPGDAGRWHPIAPACAGPGSVPADAARGRPSRHGAAGSGGAQVESAPAARAAAARPAPARRRAPPDPPTRAPTPPLHAPVLEQPLLVAVERLLALVHDRRRRRHRRVLGRHGNPRGCARLPITLHGSPHRPVGGRRLTAPSPPRRPAPARLPSSCALSKLDRWRDESPLNP